jgi:membrane associated rhomboid family serine protease
VRDDGVWDDGDGPTVERPAEVAAEPVCPRHPDRVSYVRCQRCDRPACPQCQRPAAVGFQCVDCVREQARGTPSVRTVFGGRSSGQRPVVTQTIIGLCVLFYLAQLVPGSGVTAALELAPSRVAQEPWRLLTSAFLHSPSFVLHIVFNMFVLYQVGPWLEQALGRARYAALYLICALGGSVGYLLLAVRTSFPAALQPPVVGASGAVFGLFGAMLVLSRSLGRRDQALVATIAINFVLGLVIPNVAWQGHLGGLVVGVVAALIIARASGPRRAALQWAGLAALTAALLVVAVWRIAALS